MTALVGGEFTGGRERDGLSHPLSLVPRVMNDRGSAVFLNVDGGWADSSDPADISRSWMDTRQWVRDCYKDDGHVLGISPQLGIREGRHIVGDYVVSMDDYIADRTYPDTIVRTFSHYDNHARDFGNENDLCQIWVVILGLLKAPLWGDIPYRTLLPRGISNLLVTGRAFSVHRDVFAGMRMQRDMQKLGEAAGVAAAFAVRDNTNPRNIDIKELQEALVSRGVLKSGDLSRTGTPNLSFSSGPFATRQLSGEAAAQLLPELAAYLGNGGLEEGIALWWIAKTGEQGKSFLALSLNGDERYERRRAAAFGLALLGDRRATSMLLNVLRTRDPYCPPPDLKPIPRWVAALAALRLLKATEALDDVLTLLQEAHNPGFYTFMLRYLADLAPLFTKDQKKRIVRDIKHWLQSDLPRGPFVLQNAKSPVTYEWNLEMNAAVALYACGSDIGLKYCKAYLADPRAFVRKFAEKCYETMKGRQRYDRSFYV